MTGTLYSGSAGWLLFLAVLRTVLSQAYNQDLQELGTARMTVDKVWTGADTITVSILPLNLSDHKILVSVKQESDNKIIVDHWLQEQTTPTQDFPSPIQHKMDGLEPETEYEVCASLSSVTGPHPGVVQLECYKVRTFPRVDNVKGVYGALVAVGIFLVACGLGWLLYKAIWVKYFTKSHKVHDNGEAEQPMRSRPAYNPSQDITTETEATLSSVVTTQ